MNDGSGSEADEGPPFVRPSIAAVALFRRSF